MQLHPGLSGTWAELVHGEPTGDQAITLLTRVRDCPLEGQGHTLSLPQPLSTEEEKARLRVI